MCEISYSGNGAALDAATYTAVTVNGNTYSNSKPLAEFSSLESDINTALSLVGGVSILTLATKTISGDIGNNIGDIKVYLQIIYPSIGITSASIDVTTNGTPQTINFTKIPTA